MAKYISTLHYIRLLSDPEMISVDQQTFPAVLIEQREGEEAFPKHCPACGSDELKFSRVEEYDDPDPDGHKELIKTYRIHHVVCVKCSEEGTLAHFQ